MAVSINQEKIKEDEQCDDMKGYVTNTTLHPDIPPMNCAKLVILKLIMILEDDAGARASDYTCRADSVLK